MCVYPYIVSIDLECKKHFVYTLFLLEYVYIQGVSIEWAPDVELEGDF